MSTVTGAESSLTLFGLYGRVRICATSPGNNRSETMWPM